MSAGNNHDANFPSLHLLGLSETRWLILRRLSVQRMTGHRAFEGSIVQQNAAREKSRISFGEDFDLKTNSTLILPIHEDGMFNVPSIQKSTTARFDDGRSGRI
jgi:hypothetical protein